MKTKFVHFLAYAILALAVVALAVPFGLMSSVQAAPGAAVQDRMEIAPMQMLPDAACVEEGVVLSCDLWARAGSLELPGGLVVPAWGFSDSETGAALIPGPVIRANLGQTLQITLHNDLAGEMVSLAFPGQVGLIPDLDGAAPGGTRSYTFTPTRAGSFLYEAGLTAGGARQVAMGMAGPLIIQDGTEPGDLEAVLVFSEVDPAFNTNPAGFSMLQFKPKYWLINGKAYPQTGSIAVQAGSTVRFRLINMGVQTHPIGLLGLDQTVIAENGETLAYAYGVNSAPLSSGQTKDTLVYIPASAPEGALYPLYESGLLQHNNNQRSGRRTAFGGMLTFLVVTGGGEPSQIGPTASSTAVTPAKTNGAEPVTLSATLTDDDTDVVGFEYFIDTLGAPEMGTWVDVEPAPTVFASTTISTDVLALLSGGQHTFYLRGKDAFGNWGSVGSAVLTLDKAGPAILGLDLIPNPTNGGRDLVISGTADDRLNGSSIVVAAEYQMDNGGWMPMLVSPQNATQAGISASIPAAAVAALSEGEHPVQVRAQDEFMNWSFPYGTAVLRVDKTGPSVTAISLGTTTIDLSQPLPVSVRLTATLSDTLAGGVQSTLVTAEGFIDVVGAPGSGFSLFPSDGLFDEIEEAVYYNIPGNTFANMSPGTHYVYVVGKDKAGNWGPAGSVAFTVIAQVVDNTGPVITRASASPNPTAGASSIVLTATAADTQSNIAGVVWFEGTKPPKRLNYMTPTDGSFNSLTENVEATVSIKTWKAGTYLISFRAYDAAGNWGSIFTIEVQVTSR